MEGQLENMRGNLSLPLCIYNYSLMREHQQVRDGVGWAGMKEDGRRVGQDEGKVVIDDRRFIRDLPPVVKDEKMKSYTRRKNSCKVRRESYTR